ncbi:hypothetical protein GALMADRAFT_253865 [Galerina marginata CBS 339.88]|uniref:Uncharacterized protein n=1 Tax=Galerina marginata (strain CBS 339.88) TaxID=685588 RepID=A0A067SND8_GALM3|nr:hypothetical protein GALMADRAFT_253865 [Galerina marginata CBS 339.88]
MAPTSPQIDAACQCTKCQNAVKVQGPAKAGKFPGQYFLHCMNCHWHYTFPLGIAPRAALPTSSNPSTSQQSTQQTATGKCFGKSCGRNANTACQNERCRTCCIIMGGCRVRDHSEAHLSRNGRRKFDKSSLSSNALNSEPTPSFERGHTSPQHTFGPPLTVDEYATSIIDADPFLQMVKKSELQAAQERKRAEEEAELDRQEQEQIDAVIAASLETISACETHSPPPEAQLEASSSRQQATYPPRPPLIARHPISTLLDAGIPFTEATNANMPNITNQMTTLWMRGYQDRTKQPQVIVSAGPRRGQLDAEMVQRFRIIWWERENVDPAIFPVQACPGWPKWKICDSPDVVQRLGIGLVDFYDQDFKIWVECPLTYPHTVKTDCYLLLRRQAVHCQDFAKHLLTATKVPSTSRVYMASVRKSLHVRTKSLKQRTKGQTVDSEAESEGEVEIVEDTPRPKHKKVKSEPVEQMRPTLPRLTIPHTPSGLLISSSPTSPLDTPPLVSGSATSADSLLSFFPQSPLSPLSPVPSSILSPSPAPWLSPPATGPPSLISNGESWPYNMYVFDINAGFKKMQVLKLARGGNYAQRFAAAFNQPAPVTSTYYDQINKWKNAPEAIRNTCLAAMRTRGGEWGHFLGLLNALKK